MYITSPLDMLGAVGDSSSCFSFSSAGITNLCPRARLTTFCTFHTRINAFWGTLARESQRERDKPSGPVLSPWGQDWTKMRVARAGETYPASRAARRLGTARLCPASSPRCVQSHTDQMKLLGQAYWSSAGAWSYTHLLGIVFDSLLK